MPTQTSTISGLNQVERTNHAIGWLMGVGTPSAGLLIPDGVAGDVLQQNIEQLCETNYLRFLVEVMGGVTDIADVKSVMNYLKSGTR